MGVEVEVPIAASLPYMPQLGRRWFPTASLSVRLPGYQAPEAKIKPHPTCQLELGFHCERCASGYEAPRLCEYVVPRGSGVEATGDVFRP